MLNRKLKVIIFGNCQSRIIARILQKVVDSKKYEIEFLINNSRTQGFQGPEKTYEALSQADILICQPLREDHKLLSINYLRESLSHKCKILTYSYVFNSGIQSLGYAGTSKRNSYGQIFGSDIIINAISDHGLETVIDLYKEGNIDFSLPERFHLCMDELKRREEKCDIKLADYILQNYQQEQLFISHNHPTKALFKELTRQIIEITDICPGFQGHTSNYDDIDDLPDSGSGYSPYDVMIHGYKFGYHSDWLARGLHLINMLYRAHFLMETVSPDRYITKIKYPDMQLTEEELVTGMLSQKVAV